MNEDELWWFQRSSIGIRFLEEEKRGVWQREDSWRGHGGRLICSSVSSWRVVSSRLGRSRMSDVEKWGRGGDGGSQDAGIHALA